MLKMALEFEKGDVLVKIGTNLKSKVVCVAPSWGCYYLDHFDESDTTVVAELDELSVDEVEGQYVLLERSGKDV